MFMKSAFGDGRLFEILLGILRWIGAVICNIIYSLISWLYQTFMTVAQTNLLAEDRLGQIYQRITMILTIVMVFYITFEFVKYVVQPDGITDKEKGVSNLAVRLIIVIVLIAFVPKIFEIAYQVQTKILDTQVFSKIILGKVDQDYGRLGSEFSADMLSMFYRSNEDYPEGNIAEDIVEDNLDELRATGTANIIPGISLVEAETNSAGEMNLIPAIDFDFFLAFAVGGFMLYMLVLYCIDVGVRYAQLLFLQIISPVAIMGYLSPKKDNMFSKWVKQCISTYIDLFIRLALLCFILLVVNMLGEAMEEGELFANFEGAKFHVKTLAFCAIVMGLFVFANKAPKMLQDLMPSGFGGGIGFGLKGKDRFSPGVDGIKKVGNFGRRTAGAVAGLAYGAHVARKNGTGLWSGVKAAWRGLRAGAGKGGGIRKGRQAALQSANNDREVIDSGGTIGGHDFRGVHYQRESEEIKRKKGDLETIKKAKDTVSSATKEVKVMKNTASAKADWDNRSFGDAKAREGAVKAIEKATRVYAVSAQDDAAKAIYREEIGKALDQVYDVKTNPTVQRLDANVTAATQRADATTKKATDAIAAVKAFDNIKTPLTAEQQKEKEAATVAMDVAIKERDEAIKIKNASIVARDTEIATIQAERERVLVNITSEIGSDQSVIDTLTTQIIEAKRVSEEYEYTSKDAKGNPIQIKVPKKSKDEDEERSALNKFAQEIGDVADSATKEIADIDTAEKTRRANANAAKPDK